MADFSDTGTSAIEDSGFATIEDTISERAAGMMAGPESCAWCRGPLLKARYVAVEIALVNYCSLACLRAALRQRRRWLWAARRKTAKRYAIGAVFLGGFVAAHQGPPGAPLPERAQPVRATVVDPPVQLPPGWYGPAWPPTEMSLLAALGADAWVHPLSGPYRRMPRSDSRVFGANRPGNRAIECRNGHCGVDLGGEIWGEQIHAVHDGVVDFVQRGPNPEHGGSFVRLSHRNGTIFTQYFHLAAIPRTLERGAQVKGGDIVGLLGDTGVKESAPHLHFSLSIRAWRDGPEKYVDPEPLIALWPMRVPIDGSEVALVTTLSQPAVPLGSAPGRGKKKGGKQKGADDESAGDRARAGQKGARGAAASAADDEESPEGETPEPAARETQDSSDGPEAPSDD